MKIRNIIKNVAAIAGAKACYRIITGSTNFYKTYYQKSLFDRLGFQVLGCYGALIIGSGVEHIFSKIYESWDESIEAHVKLKESVESLKSAFKVVSNNPEQEEGEENG